MRLFGCSNAEIAGYFGLSHKEVDKLYAREIQQRKKHSTFVLERYYHKLRYPATIAAELAYHPRPKPSIAAFPQQKNKPRT